MAPRRGAADSGDGIDDCWIAELAGGLIGGFSTQITYTSPTTGHTFQETICNGDVNDCPP